MGTTKLYQSNVYTREWDATVTKITENGIYFDQTAFFPEGGGQSCDLGIVQPADDTCSVNKIVKSRGVSPYHLCYETDDIDQAFCDLMEQGYIPLFRPVEAIAFENRRICYFFKKESGYLELATRFNTTSPTASFPS